MSISQYSTPTSVAPNVSSVVNILGASSPVAVIVATAVNVLQALGLSIKGSTQHLSYDEVLPKANDFSTNMLKVFQKAYTASEIGGIVNVVPARFAKAMGERWGYAEGLNASIYASVMGSPGRTDALSNQFGLFYLWVGTNIDKESSNEFRLVFDAYFSEIFLGAIDKAGLSAAKLRGDVPLPDPGNGSAGTGTGTGTTDPNPAQRAGSGSLLMLLGIGGAVWYMLRKGRR